MGENVLQKIFGQLGQTVQIAESHFRLDHPELGQVARGVGVFGTECGAKGVDVGQGQGEYFRLKLATDGQKRGLPEEVLFRIDRAILHWKVFQVQGRYPEHGSGALGIAGGNHGRLQEDEPPFLEKGVDRVGQRVSHPSHGAEGVGPGPQVGNLTQELHRVALLLQGIGLGVGQAMHLYRRGLDLVPLPFAWRIGQGAGD